MQGREKSHEWEGGRVGGGRERGLITISTNKLEGKKTTTFDFVLQTASEGKEGTIKGA